MKKIYILVGMHEKVDIDKLINSVNSQDSIFIQKNNKYDLPVLNNSSIIYEDMLSENTINQLMEKEVIENIVFIADHAYDDAASRQCGKKC